LGRSLGIAMLRNKSNANSRGRDRDTGRSRHG
jgi:hypothetical protein